MTLWIQQYWFICALALMIGLTTAAWIWLSGRRNAERDEASSDIDAPVRKKGPLEPAKPVIEMAKPVQFAPPPVAEPVAAVSEGGARPAIAAAVGEADNLQQIKGIGPKLVTLLASLGITRFDQIAAWSDSDIAEVDRFLGSFAGRISRDGWVEQAGYLARGDAEGFTARFGAIGG